MDHRWTLIAAVAASLVGAPAAGAAELVYSAPGIIGLRTVEPDGTHRRTLTDDYDWNPQWSPDRKKLLFDRCYQTSPSAEDDVCAMYVTAVAGGDAHVVRRDAVDGAWSPDGTRIAWVGAGARIYVSRPDGSHAHRLWRGPHVGYDPAWSGPANRISYSRYVRVEKRWEVHIVKPDGYGDRLVASGGFGADWSPDGRRLVYYREHSGLCVIRRDGTHRHCLHVGQDFGQPAAWSPDGSRIAYTASDSSCGVDYSVRTIRPDGTGKRLVACGSGPDW